MLAQTQLKTSDTIYEINEAKKIINQRCLIAGLFSMKEKNIETHLASVELLIEKNDGIVVGKLVQRRGVSRAKKIGGMKKLDKPMNSATYLGRGKANELGRLSKETETQIIVFLHKLSEGQKRNLSKITNCQIIECEITANN